MDNEQATEKAANLYDWIISRIHLSFTQMADEMYGSGYVTQDERKALSGGIGEALDAWNKFAEKNLTTLKERRPYEEVPTSQAITMPLSKGNALKAISQTDDELRAANYIVLFDGRDLEGVATKRKNADGSAGEYFTKSTRFDSDYTKTGVVYVDWEHSSGLDGATSDDVLGYVDWKTAVVDEKGVFVERVLNRRNRYVQYVEELIKAGLIGNSTEAITSGVAKSANGEIKAWPLRRDTLTVNPMEPRMLTQNTLAAIKGLSEKYPAMKALLDMPETPTESDPPADTGAENARQTEIAKKLGLLALLELESI